MYAEQLRCRMQIANFSRATLYLTARRAVACQIRVELQTSAPLQIRETDTLPSEG